MRDYTRIRGTAGSAMPQGCRVSGNLSICYGRVEKWMIEWQHCIDCEGKAPMLCVLEEWYGWRGACLYCGAKWADEEWLPKPFERAWRKKSILGALQEMYRLQGIEPVSGFHHARHWS